MSAEIQHRIIRLLNEFLSLQSKRNFRMAIITTSQSGHWQLFNGLKNLQIANSFHDYEMLDKTDLENAIKDLIGKDDTCVTSKISGLGKSMYVLDEIRHRNLDYIKFPVGAEISSDILAKRLQRHGIQLASSKVALHIDINAIENVRQLNELLYCLLLFRRFRFGREAVYVPSDVPIYIEFDASMHTADLKEKIIVVNYLNKKHINEIDLNSIKMQEWPEIHGVIKYLQAIKNGKINWEDISIENELACKSFEVNSCLELLKEYFIQIQNSEFITWTKLRILIYIYYQLFSGFSRCGHFLVEFMEDSQLRMNILQTLLQSSSQFTSVSVETVRNSQRYVNESNYLLCDAVVRWDTTKPFTVVFTDTDDPLFVYKTLKDIPRSVINEFDIYQRIMRNTGQDSLLSDYETMTHVQLFLKLITLSKKYFRKNHL